MSTIHAATHGPRIPARLTITAIDGQRWTFDRPNTVEARRELAAIITGVPGLRRCGDGVAGQIVSTAGTLLADYEITPQAVTR